tara:strand:- start:235 stop:1539 length:1305 start_codon:yes stop_codon:yes gene_type:complete
MPSTNQLKDWNEDRMAEIKRAEADIANLQQWNADRVTNENTLSGRVDQLNQWNDDSVWRDQNQQTQIDDLIKWNDDRIKEISGEGGLSGRIDAVSDTFGTRLSDTGDIGGRIGTLEGYFSNPDELTRLSDLDNVIKGAFGAIKKDKDGKIISGTEGADGKFITEGAGSAALAKLYEEGGAGYEGLQQLRNTLDTDWMGKTFGQRDEEGNVVGGGMTFDEISKAITDQDATTADLKTDFAGLFKEGGKGKEALSKLFEQDAEGNYTGDIGTALDDLTTDLTSKYNLDNLDTRFSSLETSAATVADLEDRLKVGGHIDTELGKIGGITRDVGDIKSDLTGLSTNIDTLRGDAEQWVSDLSTSAQTERDRIEKMVGTASTAWNQRLTDLSASMDYRTLGDSAAGVRTRKSKARSLGKTNFGTGQLNRSMRTLSGLNL